ncbi:MAG: esterase family protein [Gammaproteobacteria bacterium]
MAPEYYRWRSERLGRDMGVVVYGHWGPPLIAFPTSGGDEREHENQGMIAALADFLDAGRVKIFTAGSVNNESFYNKAAHPFHRSYVQKQFDEYVRWELIPFVQENCRTPGIMVSTMGASFGAYHAANTLFKHPDVVNRCFALSGIYDVRQFMDGSYDENFYYNNPVDYLANLTDPAVIERLNACEIRIATGSGPWENSSYSCQLSDVLRARGIRHFLDDWGPKGGHDWPFWKNQMREYLGRF